jgi:glycosyltransferase involved in cell wall biosynthesis
VPSASFGQRWQLSSCRHSSSRTAGSRSKPSPPGTESVVATTAGGLAELIADQTGYPDKPKDPESLANAIQAALAAAPDQRATKWLAGRTLAATHYNYPKTVQDFLTTLAPWVIR